MFQSWTKKEVVKCIVCFAVFFALVLATQLPGFLSPLYWALFAAPAAFVSAGPLTCVMGMKRGFGSTAAVPLLWFHRLPLYGRAGYALDVGLDHRHDRDRRDSAQADRL